MAELNIYNRDHMASKTKHIDCVAYLKKKKSLLTLRLDDLNLI